MAVTGVGSSSVTGSATGDRAVLGQNFSTFLTLLTTQLKNQDPLSPTDSTQFTNQLVLFSQVEQQIALNDKAKQQITNQGQQLVDGALGYIGLDVQATGNAFTINKGDTTEIGYAVGADGADKVEYSIVNSKGDVIRNGTLKDTSAGAHNFKWDGKDNSGNVVDAGNYKVQVTARDAQGASAQLETLVPGRVTGIQSTSSGVLLNVGSIQIPVENVITAKKPTTT